VSTTKKALLQAVRTWLVTELSLTGDQVIPADAKGARPPKPYLTVRVSLSDVLVGSDEVFEGLDEDENVVLRTQGIRRATISVRGFGDPTGEWLENAVLQIPLPRAQAKLKQLGLSFFSIGGLQDLSDVLGTGFEEQYLREFEAYYSYDSATQTEADLENVEIDIDLQSSPVNPVFPVDVNIDIDVGPGGGGGGPGSVRIGQALLGSQDGLNTVFTVAEKFVHTALVKEAVYWMGLRLSEPGDYTASESVPGQGYDTITFVDAPYSDDNVLIDYYADE